MPKTFSQILDDRKSACWVVSGEGWAPTIVIQDMRKVRRGEERQRGARGKISGGGYYYVHSSFAETDSEQVTERKR